VPEFENSVREHVLEYCLTGGFAPATVVPLSHAGVRRSGRPPVVAV
jgi:hypothetical protein